MTSPVSTLVEERLKKLRELKEEGIPPYPNDVVPSHLASDIGKRFSASSREELESVSERFSLAGRIMSVRTFGKAGFAHIKDASGRIQIFIEKQTLSEKEFRIFRKADIGDFVWVEGTPMKTKTGELSIRVKNIRLAAKSLHPLPEKWHGLTDKETRYRQRYLDLIVNDDVREVFRLRSKVIGLVREFFTGRDFLEVETPMMHPIPGGAAARPFVTHHRTLDMDLYLRVAPELYLKRLVVGGLERVFEINRSFRNEGISIQHNPEFTMLEFYQAYSRASDLMSLTEELFVGIAEKLFGKPEFSYQGEVISLKRPFKQYTFESSLIEVAGLPEKVLTDENVARKIAEENSIPVKKEETLPVIKEAILSKLVEPKLVQPTYITKFPAAISPLARRMDEDPDYTERFELFVAGREIANGFSELNDPIDQEERFRRQAEARAHGDDEAMFFDEDFVEALRYGMPPTAGEGIGIDRLVMLFADQPSIRDVICFPLLRPQS